jgi:hypothetical protein
MDYLPASDSGLLKWINAFLKYMMGRIAKFKFPQDDFDGLSQERDVYAQKLEVANESATRTSVNVKEKNIAKKVLKTHIRTSVGEYLSRNHLLTDADRELLGLPIRKPTREPVPPPTDVVALEIRQLQGHRVEVNFSSQSLDKADKEHRDAKPFGVRGAEIRWAILPESPKSQADLVHSEFDTRTPYIFQFDIPQAGQTLYICARWENTTGKKGPWGKIVDVIIP